jgi:circadian clock protein KaiB
VIKARPPNKAGLSKVAAPGMDRANATQARSVQGTAPNIRRRSNPQDWTLWLYIAGSSPKSDAAYRNLEQICEDHIFGHYHIEVIDLIKSPQIARDDQIVAVPMVVRKWPAPIRRIIGDMSNTERVLAALDLPSYEPSSSAARKGKKIF